MGTQTRAVIFGVLSHCFPEHSAEHSTFQPETASIDYNIINIMNLGFRVSQTSGPPATLY